VDFGPCGVKQSSARLTELYSQKELVGRQVIGVINFPPKQIAHLKSEVLITGFILDKGKVVLPQPERKVLNGSKLA
jgi:tRNA-binding protein